MMKINFRTMLFIIIACLLGSLMLPVLTLAQSDEGGQEVESSFCAKLAQKADIVEQKITERQNKIIEKQNERERNLELTRGARDQRLAQEQAEASQGRKESYNKLTEMATSTGQQQAIAVFQQVVEAAVAVKKEAVDAVIQNFRDGLDQAFIYRNNTVNTAVGVYKAAYQTAVARAEDDCDKGVGAVIVRTTLRGDLRAARQKFIADKQAIEMITVKPLLGTR
ncbi:MAG: hypothetical protein PHN39_03175, partial [Candidatus Pacebacteria bacterium]|nr:hypothetical protein [Candidatus Paceibacterota bacterium]